MNELFYDIDEWLRDAEDLKSSLSIFIENTRDMVEHYEDVDMLLLDVKKFLVEQTFRAELEYKERRDIERLIERVKEYTDE